MATRFAGDFFGAAMVGPDTDKGSLLLDYFPELRRAKKQSNEEEDAGEDTGSARSFRGRQAVTPFTGYKTFEAGTKNIQAAPLFSGFKTFE